MIEENFDRMLWKLAHKFKRPPIVTVEDLVSVGNIAIIKATKNFDDTRGVKLSTYIYRAIKNSMLIFTTANSGATGMSFRAYQKLSKDKNWSNCYVRTTDFSLLDNKITDSALTICFKEEKIKLVREAIEKLSEKKRFIAKNSKRFLGVLTVKELADKLCLSTQRIYQLEGEIKKTLSYKIPRSIM